MRIEIGIGMYLGAEYSVFYCGYLVYAIWDINNKEL